jgi:hypothetical protein
MLRLLRYRNFLTLRHDRRKQSEATPAGFSATIVLSNRQRDIANDNAGEARRQRDEAIVQRRNAESREYSARSLLTVERDPAEALRLAIRTGELGDNPDSEAALRRAIRASHLKVVLSHEGGTTETY